MGEPSRACGLVSEVVMVHGVGHLPPGGLAGVIVERVTGVGPEPTANANKPGSPLRVQRGPRRQARRVLAGT
jgi:hypothetical protein